MITIYFDFLRSRTCFVIPGTNKISKYDYHNISILFYLTQICLNRGLNWVKASCALLCINLRLRLVTTNCWLKI